MSIDKLCEHSVVVSGKFRDVKLYKCRVLDSYCLDPFRDASCKHNPLNKTGVYLNDEDNILYVNKKDGKVNS